MKTNSEFKFPYFLAGIALGAIAALLLAPSPGEETWKYLRERSNKGLGLFESAGGQASPDCHRGGQKRKGNRRLSSRHGRYRYGS